MKEAVNQAKAATDPVIACDADEINFQLEQAGFVLLHKSQANRSKRSSRYVKMADGTLVGVISYNGLVTINALGAPGNGVTAHSFEALVAAITEEVN